MQAAQWDVDTDQYDEEFGERPNTWYPKIRDQLLWTAPKKSQKGEVIPGSEALMKCGENARRIIELDHRLSARLAYDEAYNRVVIRDEATWEERQAASWGGLEQLYAERPFRFLADNDITEIAGFLTTHYGLIFKPNDIRPWLDLACAGRRFHSIRRWLESLEWDGKPRIGDWLIRLAGADDTPLNRAYCPRILQAAVARAFEPGCKVDTMPILTSPEGVGKSSLWMELAGDIDHRRVHCVFSEKIGSNDGTRILHSAWFVDLDECSSLRVAQADRAKQWITTSEDRIVQKYKNEVEEWPRSSVFVASTNPADVIKDPAGARRYWVIAVAAIDRDKIKAERQQLWAEAVHRHHRWEEEGMPALHWSLPPEMWAVQADSVRPVVAELPYEGEIVDFLKRHEKRMWITTQQIISECIMGELPGIYQMEHRRGSPPAPRTAPNDVANVMHRLGWTRKKSTDKEIGERRGWQRPPTSSTP